MGTTATASLGYGVKVNTGSFQEMGLPYQCREDILDTEKYPALNLRLSGFSPANDFWIFVTATTQSLHSGASGNGMETVVNSQMQISEEDAKQLNDWIKEFHQTDSPSWNLIQYVN
jgi:hypothetical protein